jgi:hypothetical protein
MDDRNEGRFFYSRCMDDREIGRLTSSLHSFPIVHVVDNFSLGQICETI